MSLAAGPDCATRVQHAGPAAPGPTRGLEAGKPGKAGKSNAGRGSDTAHTKTLQQTHPPTAVMAKDRDRDGTDASAHGQSKRPAMGAHRDTNDSQHSEHNAPQQQANPPNHHHQQQHRQKSQQKYVVGGGTSRLHGRVPSSKALTRHHAVAPSAKPAVRRQSSPSPDPVDHAFPPTAAGPSGSSSHHRRASSELRLFGHASSSTNLKKNLSATSLKRNRSHADVAKRNGNGGGAGGGGGSRSTGGVPLNRSLSNPTVAKKAAKNQVHFALGTGDDDDDDGDEWVDASSSASPYISRRGSVVSSGHPESKPDSPNHHHHHHHGQQQQSPHQNPHPSHQPLLQHPALDSDVSAQSSPRTRTQLSPSHAHSRGLSQQGSLPPPSRLLQRVPSQTAVPMMSTESATGESASAAAQRLQQRTSAPAASPDSSVSVFSTETGLAAPQRRGMASSSGGGGGGDITSRFVTTSSHDSSGNPAAGGSFYTPSSRMARQHDENSSLLNGTRSLAAMNEAQKSTALRNGHRRGGEPSSLTSEEEANSVMGTSAAGSASSRARASIPYMAQPAEKSRTQQKLNLQRASSTLEPNPHHLPHHQGPAASPLVGGAGYDTRDPRVGKLLDRAGMEYMVVRRYQNPVARSLVRLSHIPGAEKSRRIPLPNGGSPGHAKRHSDYAAVGAAARLSQSYRERGTSRPGSSAAAVGGIDSDRHQQQSKPGPPRRSWSSIRANGANSSVETDDGGGRRLHGGGEGLSGASLVDGGEDDGTLALLRNMWEKNMDLSASQE